MATHYPTPLCCFKHDRFQEQNHCWRVWDVSRSMSGKIAVSGNNTNDGRSFIDVYIVGDSSNGDLVVSQIYSQEFDKIPFNEVSFEERYVSLVEPNGDSMATCIGNMLELIEVRNHHRNAILTKKMSARASGLIVKNSEIFVGFFQSNKINVYNLVDLCDIRSIDLEGLGRREQTIEFKVDSDTIFACVGIFKEPNHSSRVYGMTGNELSTLSSPNDSVKYAWNVTVNMQLEIAVVAWTSSYYERKGIAKHVFYSLMGESNPSFLVVEDDADASLLRITDRGDRIMTVNHVLGEVKIYDMAEIFTYDHLKTIIASYLKRGDCEQLGTLLALNDIQLEGVRRSGTPAEDLLRGLEDNGVIHPTGVGLTRLRNACGQTQGQLMCKKVTNVYDRTKSSRFYRSRIQELRGQIHRLEEENQQLRNIVVAANPRQEV